MKLISKNGKKILKISKAEWEGLGKQYKWAASIPDADKVRSVINIIQQLRKELDDLSMDSAYKFIVEKNQVTSLDQNVKKVLEYVLENKTKNPSNIGPKTAQNLETVKTPEKFTEREITRAIRDAIIAEEGAIKQYETVVDASDNSTVREVLTSIANEERVHVGELQTLLNILLGEEKGFLEDGRKEVEDTKK